jgi:hypothetical protein
MLAPGDCLTAPTREEAVPTPTERGGAPTLTVPAPAAPATSEEQKMDAGEPRSFLLTLLRCLGAVHT